MSYEGIEAPIPLGQLGLYTDVPPGEVARGALIRAKNISYETGTITKARGAKRYNRTVLPSGIVGLIDYWPNNITQRLIVACTNGSLYRDTGGRDFEGNTAIATGLGTLTPKCKFIVGGQETALRDRKLFFFSGSSQLKVLTADGTSFDTVDNPAADWVTPNFPVIGLIHANRLWAFMGQRAYASDTGNHENFTSNNLTQNVYPGEGGDIIGAYVFKTKLFCFKEGGFVYVLDDTDSDSDNWVWRKLANNFGLASTHGLLEIGNDMYAVNESGTPTSYQAVNALGDIESGDVFRMMKIEDYFRANVNLSGLSVMHTLYYESKKMAFFTYRTSYRTTNNLLLVLDFNQAVPRLAFWDKDQADCLGFRKDIHRVKKPIYGSADGYVYLLDQEDRLTHATAYTGEFKTGNIDFRFMDEKIAQKNKNFDFLDVEFVPQGSWNLEIDTYIDGTFMETLNVLMDVRDDGLGQFNLGGAAEGDKLGRTETQTIRVPLHGSGRKISFTGRQAGSNQNFSIASFTVCFRLGDEKASRA